MRTVPITTIPVEKLMALFKENYETEKAIHSSLPPFEDFESLTAQSLSRLVEKGVGCAAVEGDEVCGYMIGAMLGDFFGKDPGIVVLLHAHAAKQGMKQAVYSLLYESLALQWTKTGHTSHAMVLFAHDQETLNYFFENGFGKRCVDAMNRVNPLQVSQSEIKIVKASLNQIPLIAPIHLNHVLYYRNSPIFMPNVQDDPIKDLTEWLSHENHHLWYAVSGEEVVGYMRIQPTAETVVSRACSVMNVTGAYVKPVFRGHHVSKALLTEIHRFVNEMGYSFLGVDYESINPEANRFWPKHFIPYTYSLTRRIDERIVPFLQESTKSKNE